MRSFKLSVSYIPLFLALAFLSLKGYGFYFRGNVPVLSQGNSDTWPLTSVTVGRALVVTLENVGGLSLIYKLEVASVCSVCCWVFSSLFSLS